MASLKILFLNVYEGCTEDDRFRALTRFIGQQAPDILGLSELVGWDDDNFARVGAFMQATGLGHYAFCQSRNGSPVGLFARHPLSRVSARAGDMYNGMVSATVLIGAQTLFVTVTHLTPHSEDARIAELDLVLGQVPADGAALLMGDMNALSPQDPYDWDDLRRRLAEAEETKFDGGGGPRTDAIRKILDFGLSDTLRHTTDAFQASVPTPFSNDPHHAAPMRLDYIFVSSPLVGALQSAEVLRGEETDRLSDHYPVQAVLSI